MSDLATTALAMPDLATPAPMLGMSLGMYLSLYVFLGVSYVTVLFHLARKRKSLDAEPDLGQELPK